MLPPLTDVGRALVAESAQRHGLSEDTVRQMLAALAAGGGTQAQFDIPELGGMGQWSQGGMTMVGDMFNSGLQARVSSLCADLSGALRGDPLLSAPRASQSQSQSQGGNMPYPAGRSRFFERSDADWPEELGAPSTQGAQNDIRYAVFPETRRLAVVAGGRMTIHDTGAHRIGGVSQSRGAGASLSFVSQLGTVRPEDLPIVPQGAPPPPGDAEARQEAGAEARQETGPTATSTPPSAPRSDLQPASSSRAADPPPAQPPAQPAQPTAQPGTPPRAADAATPPDPGGPSDDQIFDRIERLADLHARGILDDAEFAAKKAELLARL